MMPIPPWALLCAAALFAGFVQGLSGFGSGIILLPLLTLLWPIKTVIPLAALLALGINAWMTWSLLPHLRWKRIGVLLLATAPGIPLGAWILKVVQPWILELMVGIVIVSFTSHALLTSPIRRELSNYWAAFTGFIAGILGGSLGVGGPPIIIYTNLQPWTKDEIKVAMAGCFLAMNVAVCGVHAASGMTTTEVLHLLAIALPSVAMGVYLGIKVYGLLGEVGYRRLVMLVALALGLLMIYRAVLEMLAI